jgi:dipeptidyl aminopeptidase/acylaminoacyl peptidase
MTLKNWVLFSFAVLFFSTSYSEERSRQEILKEEGKGVYEECLRIASQFYSLEEGEELKEITEAILISSDTKDSIKQTITTTDRRFFLFNYPSDGYQVKGYISFVPNSIENNLLVFLRGGNRIFGLSHPATGITCIKDYTVIATAYRGGVSEGIDQFGGDEVNDVHNLLLFLPTLSEKLELHFHPKNTYILGGSRGGMEMFLALGRSPFLQQQVTKAASLSGLLDIEEMMIYREDMKQMFIRDFGLIPGENEESWIHLRNPINSVPNLRMDLPFLIIQGTNDLRVSLNEGYHMVAKLQENGNPIDYIEIPEGDHCLSNQSNRMELIADWFEKQ